MRRVPLSSIANLHSLAQLQPALRSGGNLFRIFGDSCQRGKMHKAVLTLLIYTVFLLWLIGNSLPAFLDCSTLSFEDCRGVACF